MVHSLGVSLCVRADVVATNTSDEKSTAVIIEQSYRVAKTHRMPYLYKSFPTKEP